jgi:hypothetical protein
MTEKDMERELRKSQNILVVLGYGVIMFGAWSLFKSILTCTLDFGYINEMISSGITAADMEGMNISREAMVHVVEFIVIAIVLIISLVDTAIRIKVGLCRGRGQGKEERQVLSCSSCDHNAHISFQFIHGYNTVDITC